jgi:hypothetical protein
LRHGGFFRRRRAGRPALMRMTGMSTEENATPDPCSPNADDNERQHNRFSSRAARDRAVDAALPVFAW